MFQGLTTGARAAWDHLPPRDAARDYIRNTAPLYGTERRARLPRRDTGGPKRGR